MAHDVAYFSDGRSLDEVLVRVVRPSEEFIPAHTAFSAQMLALEFGKRLSDNAGDLRHIRYC